MGQAYSDFVGLEYTQENGEPRERWAIALDPAGLCFQKAPCDVFHYPTSSDDDKDEEEGRVGPDRRNVWDADPRLSQSDSIPDMPLSEGMANFEALISQAQTSSKTTGPIPTSAVQSSTSASSSSRGFTASKAPASSGHVGDFVYPVLVPTVLGNTEHNHNDQREQHQQQPFTQQLSLDTGLEFPPISIVSLDLPKEEAMPSENESVVPLRLPALYSSSSLNPQLGSSLDNALSSRSIPTLTEVIFPPITERALEGHEGPFHDPAKLGGIAAGFGSFPPISTPTLFAGMGFNAGYDGHQGVSSHSQPKQFPRPDLIKSFNRTKPNKTVLLGESEEDFGLEELQVRDRQRDNAVVHELDNGLVLMRMKLPDVPPPPLPPSISQSSYAKVD